MITGGRCLWWIVLVACGCSLGGPGPDGESGGVDAATESPAGEVVDDHGGTDAAVVETSQGKYPPSATLAQVRALDQVNRFRTASGLSPVDEVEALNNAAQAHAEFIVKNCENYAVSGLSPHEEDALWPGFTGVNFWDRTRHAGYTGTDFGEVIAFVNSPVAAVSGWVDTLYHRLPILHPSTTEIGYGGASIGGPCSEPMLKKADVMDLGAGFVSGDPIVLYPPDGAVAVPVSFDGYETPQPPPPPGGFPSGYIVTVQFAKPAPFEVTGHRLLQGGDVPLEHTFLAPFSDPAQDVHADQWLDNAVALYAHEPLAPRTRHDVEIDLIRLGQPLKLRWSFTTGSN